MHWLNLQLQICSPQIQSSIWTKFAALAPFFSVLTAIANLLLAIYVFGYTKKKNTTDIKIKWFLELVYSPNKEALASYFNNLHTLKDRIPANGQWTEETRIDVMNFVKGESGKFQLEFVEVLATIVPIIHKKVNSSVELLTDKLVKAVDNDELKLENLKTYSREITAPIMEAKSAIIKAIFDYQG
jgi:hypothetical protein